ncbi:MAG: glucosidase [Intrasporangium sp.]|uniref:MGH1-like glycoside hydrolase domain-containing protein n=1 Tax=Intrasporangium sp. TaxID=1925024 RepID=UPI002648C866|nr:glucosidase [Intrasporangium sp.]MDN5796334.1 glucosidase [Intrasporangium sp.]
MGDTAEHRRLDDTDTGRTDWRLWGPYLAGRQWGTVREDYSADGDAWGYLPFDHAHLRAYRWGEDGIAGLTDRHGFLCLALGLWNGKDDRLKERYFGLTNPQGNHGEDVKEYWWHLDATPSHSYAEMVYRYPQGAFPYAALLDENARRGRDVAEYELRDTGVLDEGRFFDVRVVHAKASPDDVLVEITATNHGPDPAPLHLVPQLWFRNTWAWGRDDRTPSLRLDSSPGEPPRIAAHHDFLGDLVLEVEQASARVLFCDNESNAEALWGVASRTPYPTDGVNREVVHGDLDAVNPALTGTKVGIALEVATVAPGQSVSMRLRLHRPGSGETPFGDGFDAVVKARRREADEFYDAVIPTGVDEIDRHVARRAFAGLMWCQQHYHYWVREWLEGDPAEPPPPAARRLPGARNVDWGNIALADVISMPDEWEYPWFATWDLAFHCVTLAHVYPELAKQQLLLLTREWAQHPDGSLPAYEWAFSDVNPPVHAWAAWRVYVIDGRRDQDFLLRILAKLLLNYSWWLNRKDPDGSNLFSGGFLGMDNIGLFDRSRDVPPGWRLEQSDATSWMACYSAWLMRISLELAYHEPAWADLATTFIERFCAIAEALEKPGRDGVRLWNEDDGFFYDALVTPSGSCLQLRVRSLVGLLPLLAVTTIPAWVPDRLPEVMRTLAWFDRHRPDLADAVVPPAEASEAYRVLRVVDPDRLLRLCRYLLDETEFLSPHGIRSLSASCAYEQQVGSQRLRIDYEPGESRTGLFGGNSNWRGPVWFPVNALLVDALREHCRALGDGFTLECPTGSGQQRTLIEVADEIERRLVALFRPDADGHRPSDPRDTRDGALWRDHPTFSEYFHGDTGVGLGASHQTGWTALVAHLICTTPGVRDRHSG